MLGWLDYLSRINDIPLRAKYDDIRSHSLEVPLYPREVLLAEKLGAVSDMKKQCRQQVLPEYLRFNIIGNEVRNAY